MPPEEHCNTANVEGRELQETSRVQQCTVAPTEKTHDVAKGENQPDLEEGKDPSVPCNQNQSTIKEKLRSKVQTSETILEMSKELSNLTTTTTSNNIPYTDVDMNTLESKVNTLQELLPEIIKSSNTSSMRTTPSQA